LVSDIPFGNEFQRDLICEKEGKKYSELYGIMAMTGSGMIGVSSDGKVMMNRTLPEY
jgi:hypothetical protein